jgi:hypothetical protein
MTLPSAELPSQPDSLLGDPAHPSAGLDAALEVDRCLDELSRLAQTAISRQDFYAALLDRAICVLAAEGAAAWYAPAGEPRTLLAQIRFPRPLLSSDRGFSGGSGSQRLTEVVVLPPFARAGARYPSDHPYPWPLAIAPLVADACSQVVVEVVLDRNAGANVQRGAEHLLGVMSEIAADYERRRELSRLRERDARAARFTDLVLRLHAALDLKATAYAVANDGRQWIECDRLSVLSAKDGRAVTLAVSAVDHIDRRSAQVVALERLAAAVAAIGEAVVWHETNGEALPPQIQAALQEYLDKGHARQLIALPIFPPVADDAQRTHPQISAQAVLIAESFVADAPLEAFVERGRALAGMTRTALNNAFTYQALPLLPVQRQIAAAIGALGRRPLAAWLAFGAAAIVATVLAAAPAEFVVEVEGALQPQVRRNLFAPSDAIVEKVLVVHGAEVAKGETLLRLHSPALDLDRSRLTGELQTARSRLSAVRTARSRPQKPMGADENELASEEEQLAEQVAGLENQLSVVEQLRGELVVTSPLEGVVLTWNTHESLDDRPVKQGQVLLTVAEATGSWVVELQVPDADAGHVLAAHRGDSEPLPVTFLLASDPGLTHRGQLEQIAQTTHTSGGATVAQAVANVAGPLPQTARAGGGVTARIHCGQRSLGYVWLHDLIDFVRTTFWF